MIVDAQKKVIQRLDFMSTTPVIDEEREEVCDLAIELIESQAAEIERLKEDAERASALLNNVYVVNCRIQCDDVEDMNWFDARDRIMNAAKGDKNAAARTHFAAIRRY